MATDPTDDVMSDNYNPELEERAHTELLHTVLSLNSSRTSSSYSKSKASLSKTRPDRTEPGAPSLYGFSPSATGSPNVSPADLLNALKSTSATDVMRKQFERLVKGDVAPSSRKQLTAKSQKSEPPSKRRRAKTKPNQQILNEQSQSTPDVEGESASAPFAATLPTPKPKLEAEREERIQSYETVCKKVSAWQPFVDRLASAESLQFPLDRPQPRLRSSEELAESFVPRTPLEKALAEAMGTSSSKSSEAAASDEITWKTVLTRAEQKVLKAMSLSEARLRRAELLKCKSLLSFQEEKWKREARIKSKRWHRVKRRAGELAKERELERLRVSDPDAFRERVERVERERVEERAALRHRSDASKFARRQKLFAKFNAQARDAMDQMHQIGKKLTEKRAALARPEDDMESSGDDESSPTAAASASASASASLSNAAALSRLGLSSANPWLQPANADADADAEPESAQPAAAPVDAQLQGMLDAGVPLRSAAKLVRQMVASSGTTARGGSSGSATAAASQSVDEAVGTDEPMDQPLGVDVEEAPTRDLAALAQSLPKSSSSAGPQHKKTKSRTSEPAKSSKGTNASAGGVPTVPSATSRPQTRPVEARVQSSARAEAIELGDEEDLHELSAAEEAGTQTAASGHEDAETQRRLTIAEAFADDDVLAEFREEKRALEEEEQPKSVDLTLPGWGEWAGPGLEVSQSKRKKFLIMAPKLERKDGNLDGVIIREKTDNVARKYQVSQLPHPMKRVADWERLMSLGPLGREWNSESAFRRLTQPPVRTALGAIIWPPSKAQLSARKSKQRRALEADAELAALDRALLDGDEPTLAAAAAASDQSDAIARTPGEKKSNTRPLAEPSTTATNDTAHPPFILVD